MYYTAYLLAWRYLFGRKNEYAMHAMIWICFCGIIIGTFVLTLSMCIMNGFEQATYNQLQGIHSDITMHAYGQELDIVSIEHTIQKEFPEISAMSPYTTKQLILQKEDSDDISHVIMLKAVDPDRESLVSIIQQKIISKDTILPHLIKDHYILIGNSLAQQLELTIGDTVYLLFSHEDEMRTNTIRLHKEAAQIAGIFKSGIEEFDTNMIYGSFELVDRMFSDHPITHLHIKPLPYINIDRLIERLQERFQMDAYSWKDLYPAIVSALKLEKYVTLFILALIILISSMNIISLLFMYITHKKRDIAILYALGAPQSVIRTIFLLIGMVIAITAATLGLLLAALAGFLLQTYPFITLPDTYFVTHLPVYMELQSFFIIWCFVVGLSFCATWFSARKILSMHVATILRYEG